MAPAAAPQPPRRIISLNLCADQFVLALADRSQIAGLTRNATNADMSAEADKARGLHLLGQSAEEVLAIDPELIVGMGARRGAMAVLSAHHYPTLDLKSAESYDAIVASIRAVAEAVGHVARGEALIADMDRELAALSSRPGKGRVAAYYQRRGFMTGTGTLIDDLMTRVGLRNLAGVIGKPALSQLSLEELTAAQPDYLIIDSTSERIADQGTEMLHHPILARIPRLAIPQAWTVCGGPAYVLAARSLARQITQTSSGYSGAR
ncbi:ABC transporter substrate-binding protein [Sphingomonas sp. BIUV-7]|uniref:ABC transporter substrate-binding protein n=2 Tax=Sphingomonas natans TaxID=3063330 RepID=A0ABT8Y9D5_9SPHN|nr:ABC transporter substrate-binding protein [Sphingomonas sp. BIUV-7]MDO6414938.1 ABC transporter substrate-binding protein [Sphingomonas sp. BIUV-7]